MSEKPNFHKINEERNALRELERRGELETDIERSVQDSVEEEHERFRIQDFGSLANAKRELRFQKREFDEGLVIDWNAIKEAIGKKDFAQLSTIEEKTKHLSALIESRSKKLREMNGNPKKTELYKAIVRAIGDDLRAKEAEFDTLKESQPEVFRMKDLLAYREGLFDEGHIAEVPSVQRYLAKIEEAMIEGKPMFLHGPTGTGKTSLAIRAAKKLTGKEPEIVYCNPQTRESHVFGKPKISIDTKTGKQITEFDPMPLVRAMKEGKVIIFDEFTLLPKEMMGMLKGIMSARPGDVRSVTGDGSVTIAQGFQMIFTANLKSEKNKERSDIPPEMANEFAQNNIEVKYQTKDESYDIMLARLMAHDGSITMSEYDMVVTLPKLCEAMEEIQRAYTDVVEGDLGGKEGLKKLVFNQRTVENILARWYTKQLKGEEGDFVTFLDEQLTIPLTFREYSDADRSLAAKILARHGLLSTVSPERLGLAKDTFSFNADVGVDRVKNSGVGKRYSVKEVAKLDPFGVRSAKAKEDIDAATAGARTGAGKNESATAISPEAIAQFLTTEHSPATLDTSFEGGIVSVTVPQEIIHALQTWHTGRDAYERADGGSPPWVNDILKDYPYAPLTSPNIDFLVLNHGKTTPQERDTLVSTMAKAGYRPPTLAELIALGIVRPNLNKRNEILNAYKPHPLGGVLRAPCLGWDGSRRGLGASGASRDWLEFGRFLFVRK